MDSLKSENVVVSAPFSFNGSALRIWKITKTNSILLKWLLLVPLALTLIFFAWSLVALYYLAVYGFIWLWWPIALIFFPYRLVRRSGRKQKRDKLRHRELLEAIQRKQ